MNGYREIGSVKNEDGVALLLTVFIVALATILITELSHTSRFDLRSSRGFTEGIQANFALKSGINFGKTLLKVPKQNNNNEDWLGEPWALSEKIPLEPIVEISATPRILIVDEDSKIDVNGILDRQVQQNLGPNVPTSNSMAPFWRIVISDIFKQVGYQKEQYPQEQFRTLGNISYEADDQVAVINDWLDADKDSFKVAGFQGAGIESSSDKEMFFNRPLKNISELLLVPGITLDRFTRVALFLKVGFSSIGDTRRINVNTASKEVLTALGFDSIIVGEILNKQGNESIKKTELDSYTQGDPYLRNTTAVTSNSFSVYVRVVMPNATRWVKAYLQRASGISRQKVVVVKQVEFY